MFPEWDEERVKKAIECKQDGMGRADAHAEPDWMSTAYRAVSVVAKHRVELTPDAVIGLLKHWEAWPPREPRALGPVMLKAAKSGLISNTGKWVNSALPERHCRPIPVYKSLVYEGAGT
jgi:hypothetical protein